MHPDALLTPEHRALVEIFYAWRGNGMAAGFLPFAGGYAEQPALLMTCLRIMGGAANRMIAVDG